jgi:hypothetical protein
VGDISDTQLAERFELVGSVLLKHSGDNNESAFHPGEWSSAEVPGDISDLRGGMFWEEGATGVADTFRTVAKDAADSTALLRVPVYGLDIIAVSNAAVVSLTNNITTAQNIFPSANDALTVEASTTYAD